MADERNTAGADGLPIDPGTEKDQATEAYNFSRAGQISHEQMRSVGTVNDLFARNLMHTLGAWLRTQFQVKMTASKQISYTEFLVRIKEPTYVCSIRMEPLGALGLLELDLSLAMPIVDLLLGGTGRVAEVRELTDIEDAILGSVVERIVRELNGAWLPVGLRFLFEKRETMAQVARMMPPSEKTMAVSFDMQMPEVEGTFNLCLPTVVLNNILRQLATDRERPRRRSEESEVRMRELLGEASFGAVLQFPPMRLKARELAGMVPGTILRLPLPRHAAAELRVGGIALGRARPVRMREHRGAQMQAERAPSQEPSQERGETRTRETRRDG
jgi:flagellar motor switch protein FliM